jgi:signal peptidase I
MASIVFFGFLTIGLLLSKALEAWFLKLGAKWTRSPHLSFLRAFAIILTLWVLTLLLVGAIAIWNPDGVIGIAALLASLVLVFVILMRMMQTTFLRTLGAFAISQLACIPTGLLVAFVIKPYLLEAYVIPTNSMAPTILGEHLTGTCPRCNSTAYASLPYTDSRYPVSPRIPESLPGICSVEMTYCLVSNLQPSVGSRDRIVVNKLMKPRRWDLVVFRWPQDPSTPYVKRLVGLSGEEITIRDGAVWADGKKLTPPADAARLHYLDKMEGLGPPLWGSEEQPAKLSEGEYFMLGDNSSSARDSRLWEEGAAGHPPYAVPADHIIGVVTHVYWPLSRYRVFR